MLSIFCPDKVLMTAKNKNDSAFIKGVPTYASLSFIYIIVQWVWTIEGK